MESKPVKTKNIIGRKLRELREKRALSQKELSEKMQIMNVRIGRHAVSGIELGKRMVTDYELRCFCEILNIGPSELLKGFEK